MSSTNKTTNYDLSQYIGSDKPTYLSDYNGDMSKIDAQMKVNADNITLAVAGIETAQTTANTANTTANSANTLANTANTKANQVESDLNSFMQKFNLTSFKTYNASSQDVSYDPTTEITFSSQYELGLTLAKNSDGSIFKLYGTFAGTTSGNGTLKIVLNNTGITVDSPFTINPVGWTGKSGTTNSLNFRNVSVTVENNKMTFGFWCNNSGYYQGFLPACIYFNANFGDQN